MRSAWGAILALLLALRLIGGAGYMPAFNAGALSIVVCPGADENTPLALNTPHHHHHGRSSHDHGSCPYAAAASLAALGPDWTPLLASILLAFATLPGTSSIHSLPPAKRIRPPSRAPPVAA
jgi:hypothetical protein